MHYESALHWQTLGMLGMLFLAFAFLGVMFYTYQKKVYPRSQKRASWRR